MRHRPANPSVCAALAAALTLWVASPAAAVSNTVFYDGIGGAGVSAQTAMDSGVPITTPNSLQLLDLDDFLIARNLLGFTTNAPASAASDWSASNQLGTDLENFYLVFAQPLASDIQVNGATQDFEYAPEDVGLGLQFGEGGANWLIFEVQAGSDLYYYPAVSLGSLGNGQSTDSPFRVNYVLDNPQLFFDGNEGFELGIPKWNLLAGFFVIPEPGTGLLFALGIAALAAGRRRTP